MLKIVTWNMAFWSNRSRHDDAWRWLLTELRPDIAFCQECVPPDWVADEHTVLFNRAYPAEGGSTQPWGTALVSCLPTKRTRLPELDTWLAALPADSPGKETLARIHRADGWIECGEVTLPGVGPVLTISVHNPAHCIEAERLDAVDVSDIRLRLNKDVWLLDALFHFLEQRLDPPLLVGGDFNYSRLLDDLYGERGNHEFFDRVESEGFVSLHRKFHDQDEQTFFRPRGREHQLDYLYANRTIGNLARSCVVLPRDEVQYFSDHAPIVAELEACESSDRRASDG